MATHSNILAWRISWREEPGGLQSTGCKELDTTEQLTLTELTIQPWDITPLSVLYLNTFLNYFMMNLHFKCINLYGLMNPGTTLRIEKEI